MTRRHAIDSALCNSLHKIYCIKGSDASRQRTIQFLAFLAHFSSATFFLPIGFLFLFLTMSANASITSDSCGEPAPDSRKDALLSFEDIYADLTQLADEGLADKPEDALACLACIIKGGSPDIVVSENDIENGFVSSPT